MIAYTFYPNDSRVRGEAEALASHGFHVRCLTTSGNGAPSRFMLGGVEVQELAVPKYRGKKRLAYVASYLRFLVASSRAVLALLVRRELDVLHVHNVPDFLVLAGVLPRLAGTRVVLDVHDSVPETFASKFRGSSLLWRSLCMEERLSALVAHTIICVNQVQRDVLVARGIPARKTYVSLNVPDPKIFPAAAVPVPDVVPASNEFNLVYHGTMAERLGVDLVIRAVALLQRRVPRLRLNLWGDGDDLGGFRRLANELGIADRVLFRPQGYPLDELSPRLRAMHVGVIGNRHNAACDLMLPVKLLEYVALGIPAVVPRLKTIGHYFTDDMATYYEPENVDSLAAAIFRLCSDPQLRRRQALEARSFFVEHGWEQHEAAFVGLYKRLSASATEQPPGAEICAKSRRTPRNE